MSGASAINTVSRSRSLPISGTATCANVRIPLTDLDADGQLPASAWAAADALVRRALELGGTITGEHGIGLLKRRWLREELGDVQYELQRGLKRYFDPTGILNPGKVFLDE